MFIPREKYTCKTAVINGPLLFQVKSIVIDASFKVVSEERVSFDADLAEYRTSTGFHAKGKVVTSPTIMWVKALDMLMEKIRISGVDFSEVAALSGCGQVREHEFGVQ
jgi:xylulokinase